MKVLFVCATPEEAVFSNLTDRPVNGTLSVIPHGLHQIDILVTGVGMTATAFQLGRQLLRNDYDLAVNIGVCGAFNHTFVGKVVDIRQDCFADFGAEDDEAFLDVFQTGLMDENAAPFINGLLYADYQLKENTSLKIPDVKGITVNKSSGNENTIDKLKSMYNADVESMEGAAFLYCCKMSHTPCIQIRAVSNLIEKRNRTAWKIQEALSALRLAVATMINAL